MNLNKDPVSYMWCLSLKVTIYGGSIFVNFYPSYLETSNLIEIKISGCSVKTNMTYIL